MAISQQMAPLPVDLLVLAAHAPELIGLRPHLGDSLTGSVRQTTLVAKTIGVGMAVSGAGAANRIHQLAPRAVLLLGSCGIYPGPTDYQPLDLVVPSRCHLFDPSVAAGKAEFPEPMQTVLDPDPGMSQGLLRTSGPRARHVPVATTLAITTDDVVSRAVFPATGFHAENLELFPIALACRAAGVPFCAVLGVTNLVGSTGREDWRKYQRDAAILAAEAVMAFAQAGMPGLPPRVSSP